MTIQGWHTIQPLKVHAVNRGKKLEKGPKGNFAMMDSDDFKKVMSILE